MPLEEVMRDTTALGGIALYGFIALFFLLLGKAEVFVQLAIGIVLLYAVIAPLRLLFFRVRPDRSAYAGLFTKIDAGSFPSMHSARSTLLAIVLGTVFNSALAWALLALAVVAVLSTRVMLKRHYVTDILGGVVIGVLVGWLAIVLTPMVLGAF
jgi:membrane-associated phospholipid phosphatase